MSEPAFDSEISLFSLSLAKNLIYQTIFNAANEAEDNLETDVSVPPMNFESFSQEIVYAPKFDPIDEQPVQKELAKAIGMSQEPISQEKIMTDAEAASKFSSININIDKEEDLDEVDEDIDVGPLPVSELRGNLGAEESISKIFDKPGFSESSIFPFSFIGDPLEVFQKYSRQGYLLKKSTNVFVGWQKRFFEIRGFKIYYSKSLEMLHQRKEVRCINLFVNPCQLTEIKGQTFQIAIEGVKKKLKLKASSQAEAKLWTDFFQDLFKFVTENQARASKYITAKREKLLKIDMLTEEEFLEKVETGDLLLFKSSHMAARFQRTFTNSKYDHVGLIVRAFDDIYLYDSVYNGGVQLTNWKDFKTLEYYKDYVRIAYRKLEVKDPQLRAQIQENLFKFVTEHTGKKYQLSLMKLLRRNSNHNINSQSNIKNIAAKKEAPAPEGFFCSELIAAAYKSVGLLNPFVASTRYLPVSFSEKKGLKLLRDSNLSNEFGLALTDSKIKAN